MVVEALPHGYSARTVAASQRERILDAMVEVVGERGFAACSVELVIARAGVSRRTFYREFDALQDCFVAVLDLGAVRVTEIVSQAFVGRETWLDGLRFALASLLVVFDSEPLLTRVWLVESMAAGSWALAHREHRLGEVLSLISRAWPLPDSFNLRPFVIEATFASVRSIVVQHVIADREDAPLIELLGPLMGLIAAPFVGEDGVQREIERGDELAREVAASGARVVLSAELEGGRADVVRRIREQAFNATAPAVLSNPNAHRVRRCLLFLAEHPGSSNSEVAAGIGITRKGQVSALLARLARAGLVLKKAQGPGKRNEWRLTLSGEEATASLRAVVPDYREPAAERSQLGR